MELISDDDCLRHAVFGLVANDQRSHHVGDERTIQKAKTYSLYHGFSIPRNSCLRRQVLWIESDSNHDQMDWLDNYDRNTRCVRHILLLYHLAVCVSQIQFRKVFTTRKLLTLWTRCTTMLSFTIKIVRFAISTPVRLSKQACWMKLADRISVISIHLHIHRWMLLAHAMKLL